MRVLLSTIGSRGDVQPLVALAVQLRELGQEARVCAPPDFREWIDGLGIAFVPIGPEVRGTAKSSPAVARARPTREQMRQIAEATVATQFEVIPAAAEGCDILVGGGALQVALRSVAEQRGIPYVYATRVRRPGRAPVEGTFHRRPGALQGTRHGLLGGAEYVRRLRGAMTEYVPQNQHCPLTWRKQLHRPHECQRYCFVALVTSLRTGRVVSDSLQQGVRVGLVPQHLADPARLGSGRSDQARSPKLGSFQSGPEPPHMIIVVDDGCRHPSCSLQLQRVQRCQEPSNRLGRWPLARVLQLAIAQP